MQLKNKKAFTLVELSIVIVIIGLLVGGVTAGMSLVKQARIRGSVSDINGYIAALYTFKLQYNSLPGDMTNAFAYWGTPGNCTNNNVNSVATGCNGNGNRSVTEYGETFRAWQHLALAGVIQGTYTGTHTANVAVPGINTPLGRIPGASYTFMGSPTILWGSTGGLTTHNPVLTGGEAYAIDVKSDDGLPFTGKIVGWRADGATTCNNSPTTPYAYVLTDTTPQCKIGTRF